ncbi:hypothetical protein [Klebsiella pneumoniae]
MRSVTNDIENTSDINLLAIGILYGRAAPVLQKLCTGE